MSQAPHRIHTPTRFYKYMPASTARIVMASTSLRWSSPVRFNDPFDTPRELAFGVKPSSITEALELRLKDLVRSPPLDTSRLQPKIRVIVEAARRASAGARGELLNALSEGFAGEQPDGAALDQLRAIWRRFIPDFRILSLTEDPASASMWNHYADGMKGAVLELACVDELDSPWLVARPVTYTVRAEDMFSAAELADVLLMPQELAQRAILDLGTLRKSPEWSYEREWRVVSSRRMTGVGDYTDFPFNVGELAAVYFGPRIAAEDRAALIAGAKSFPNARVVQVEIGPGQGFQFREVSG